MGQNWVARNPLSTVVLSVCLRETHAFVAPSFFSLNHEHRCQQQQQRYCPGIAWRGPVLRRSSVCVAMTQEFGDGGEVETSPTDVPLSSSEEAAAKAANLRAIAAELRAQVTHKNVPGVHAIFRHRTHSSQVSTEVDFLYLLPKEIGKKGAFCANSRMKRLPHLLFFCNIGLSFLY